MANEFTIALQKFAKDAPEKAQEIARKVSIELLKSVVLKSPVGNPSLWKNPAPAGYVGGRFRANWNVGIGSIDLNIGAPPDKTGQRAIAKGTGEILASEAGQDIYITNSLPYAQRLEYEGWSSQAPQGMVRITIAQFNGIVNREARKAGE